MSIRSFGVNHGYRSEICLRKGRVASPPPMANRPVLKNSRNSSKKSCALPPDHTDDNTGSSGDNDHHNGRNAEEGDSHERNEQDNTGRNVNNTLFRHFPHGLQHKRADRDADSGKCVLHDSEMRKLLDKCGNDRDNNQRWRDHACRGGNAAENADASCSR